MGATNGGYLHIVSTPQWGGGTNFRKISGGKQKGGVGWGGGGENLKLQGGEGAG